MKTGHSPCRNKAILHPKTRGLSHRRFLLPALGERLSLPLKWFTRLFEIHANDIPSQILFAGYRFMLAGLVY